LSIDLTEIVAEVCRDVESHIGAGRVADYIPALSRIDPRKFGMAIIMCDGETVCAGDAEEPFSIQSVSKVFTLTLALERIGSPLWARVGREATGSAYNSIVQLENEAGIPRNPLINAGALVVTDALLDGRTPPQVIDDIIGFFRRCSDDPSIGVDPEVARSESEAGHRNASLAHFMRSFGNLKGQVDDVLAVYFQQCAIEMSCHQLARAGLYFAHAGSDPVSGEG
jgi:glutaminase